MFVITWILWGIMQIQMNPKIGWKSNSCGTFCFDHAYLRWQNFRGGKNEPFLIFLLFLSSMLVERIDEDKDGYVTVEEMKKWIKHAQKRWIYDDVDRQWKSHDLNGDNVVSWEEYKNATYGYILGTRQTVFVSYVSFIFIDKCTLPLLDSHWKMLCLLTRRWSRPWRWLQLQADDGSWWEEIQNGWPGQWHES